MSTSGIYAHGSRIKVLFVDDDEDTRFAYESVASGEGFDVDLAADGHEAIALASIVVPDVVVLDVRLDPRFDGFEVARRLRASPRTCAIPIVFVTGDVSVTMRRAVDASGCDGHLSKPCSADALLGLLHKLGARDEVRAIRSDMR